MKSRQASSSSSIRPSLKRHSWQSSSSSVISSWSFNEQEPVQASEKTVVTRNKGPPKPDLSSLFMAKESPSLLAMDLASYVRHIVVLSRFSSEQMDRLTNHRSTRPFHHRNKSLPISTSSRSVLTRQINDLICLFKLIKRRSNVLHLPSRLHASRAALYPVQIE